MAKKRGDRFATPADVVAALTPYARGDANLSAPPAPPGPRPAPGTVPIPSTIPGAPPPPGVADDVFAFTDAAAPTEVVSKPASSVYRSTPVARPRWTGKRKLAAGLAALALVVGIAVAARSGKKTVTPSGDGDRTAKATEPPAKPPVGKAAPRPAPPPLNPWRGEVPKLLMVLPESGLWFADYDLVKKAFEKSGGQVVTAGTASSSAWSWTGRW